ncbi:hypothetical protein [Serratia sp. UGAL515B_01]|uniref:hypothetical protein n=1 Tax=Serratia sp. UGAL515B_01 TaxID=2986763 RepID=UPI0029530678|nr:hypothetical protein [Serratia sp. UGAL515B_01]WON75549.1 hypothetical protein OK023_00090 [Serratia sp. UGAL515B_01]
MSFISYVEYKDVMPDGLQFDNLLTKDLEFGCLFYRVYENRLLREEDDGSVIDIAYVGNLYVYNNDKEYRAYIMKFDESGNLQAVNVA